MVDSEDDVDVPRRQKVVRPRNDLLIELDDIEFKKRFRMNKASVQRLSELLVNVEEPLNNRNQPITKMNEILICLRFYATGSFK
ncbi:hypothetical protein NQ314_012673 [Rhamnusium bicolor]|uniref:Uncharacterized protein n=1 Tax=Rhamnusium bicolor TaxID=1586634 RepID=A0AAV8XB67_9CUCU|nr:hypothetical protein NQ314_012673 [Rhamnusium bicolor]